MTAPPLLRLAVVVAASMVAAASAAAQAPAVAAPAGGAEILERVVAVVDDRPLLLSDVRVLAAVRGLDAEAAREAAIEERLMHVEAARLAQAEVLAEEENTALARLLEQKPALGQTASRSDLVRLVRRQIAILKYVEFRFRPQVRVSDEDVRKAWEAEEVGRPSGLALEDAQAAIRQRLERKALDERIEDWIGELRSRAEVRLVGPAAGAAAPAGPPPS